MIDCATISAQKRCKSCSHAKKAQKAVQLIAAQPFAVI